MTLDIFKSPETESKIEKKFENDWYNWEQVKQDLEEINNLKKIDRHLDNLEDKTWDNIEKYYKYLLSLYTKNNTLDKPKEIDLQKVKEVNLQKEKEKKKKKAEVLLKKELSWIPIIWNLLIGAFWLTKNAKKEDANFFDKILGSLWAWILSFFSSNIFKKYKESISWLEDIQIKAHIENPMTIPDNKESMENKKRRYEQIGFSIIKQLADAPFNPKDNSQSSYELIKSKNLSHKTLKNYTPSTEELKKFNLDIEQFNLVKDNIWSPETRVFLDSILSAQTLERLSKNTKVVKMLTDLWIDDIANLNWRTLEIEKLMILTSLSASSIVINWISIMWDGIKTGLSKILSSIADIDLDVLKKDFEQDIEVFEKEVISRELFLKIMEAPFLGESNSFDIDKEDLKNELNIDDNSKLEDTNQIEKLLKFRDFVETDILNNERYHLWYKDIIIENISLKHLLELYIIFEWKTEINGTLNSSTIYTWIINILNDWWDRWWYFVWIKENIIGEAKNIKQEDKDLLKLLLKFTIDKLFLDNLKKIAKETLQAWKEIARNNPEISAIIAWIILIAMITPVWRFISVLTRILGLKWITLLAWSGAFALFYNYIRIDQQNELKKSQNNLWIDIEKILKEEKEASQ